MPFIDPGVAEAARLVLRQTASAAATAIASAASSSSSATTSVTATPTSTASTAASPTDTSSANPTAGTGAGGNSGGGGGSGGSSNSPLLFFVALGFGVVFTNLWIIVGVKYCFRYNARSRQMRLAEDGEPINMEAMPRPHRRRREKKLMSIDEVNEKFPMLKYKAWVASRAQEGLPTRGGVSAPPSRANSIRDEDGIAPELPSKERMSIEERPTTSTTTNAKPETQPQQHSSKDSTSSTVATISKDENRASHYDDEEDDEHINAALPPECMGTSGDTCAICIDSLEDDDDVRGLTCGHAFHAVCLDPWLTSRRACCPLCKADYYTPKPRPAAADPTTPTTGIVTVSLPGDPRTNRMNLPTRPGHTFLGLRRPSRTVQPLSTVNSRSQQPRSETRQSPSFTLPSQAGNSGLFANLRNAFPALRTAERSGNSTQSGEPVASAVTPVVTPSNLEAGVRN
ncbi:hypothetical protein B0T22DRAFT_496931 [Podospora appendiculata]|uniref:RING-type domain-containing protein n=1 Tax=Podospora appendiculata TaxID=314037 RepID=A0AAE0XJR0_9PEZI|nr:hypothetical protein B0T22DRAFT_496931 [Podospora appendiculata]